MYAFIAEEDGPDDEGVCAFDSGIGWMPMVGADIARVEDLKQYAQFIANTTGKKIKLVKFSVRTELEVIEGKET